MRTPFSFTTLVIAALLFASCGDDGSSGDTGTSDTGTSDTSTSDTGTTDTGTTDSSVTDTGAGDTSVADSGADAPDSSAGTAMSFFVSSTALTGDGDLGGLAGADAHCQALASAAGAVRTAWVAYLSTAAVNAVDRIGPGPWYNADEDVFSPDTTTLHVLIDPVADRAGYIAAKPADALFMDENGDSIPGRSHDIFTGSNADGTVFAGRTCDDWTSNDSGDVAQVGHSDTPSMTRFSPSWNSAHDSAGCDTSGVEARGGVGLIYCFATD